MITFVLQCVAIIHVYKTGSAHHRIETMQNRNQYKFFEPSDYHYILLIRTDMELDHLKHEQLRTHSPKFVSMKYLSIYLQYHLLFQYVYPGAQ